MSAPVPEWDPSAPWGSGDGVLANAKLVYTPGWDFKTEHKSNTVFGTGLTRQVCIAFYGRRTGRTTLFIIYETPLSPASANIQSKGDFDSDKDGVTTTMKKLDTKTACANARELNWFIQTGLFEEHEFKTCTFCKVPSKTQYVRPLNALLAVLHFCKDKKKYDYPIWMYTVDG